MKQIYYSMIYTCLNNLFFLYGMNITKTFFFNKKISLNQDENDKENKKWTNYYKNYKTLLKFPFSFIYYTCINTLRLKNC